MANDFDVAERLTQAALDLACERGWRNVSLAETASRAGVPLLDTYRTFPDKTALLCGLIVATDRAMLEEGAADPNEPARDRLFDILMRRFDALQSRRDGMIAIIRDIPLDPLCACCLLPRLSRSLAWTLEAAGISSAGGLGFLRIKALGVLYLSVLRIWLADDTPDMARTMAMLDKALQRIDSIARILPGSGKASREGQTPDETPPLANDEPPGAPA
ncbi:MAG: hypothetical protein IPK66_00230 [Rhodospirillales bacterium]|nr:hypothetical protein [Rhodospirillales bacterium]